MSSYLEIPVIIPSYEPDEKLITLLHALQAVEIRHVIVVDDGSGEAYTPCLLYTSPSPRDCS